MQRFERRDLLGDRRQITLVLESYPPLSVLQEAVDIPLLTLQQLDLVDARLELELCKRLERRDLGLEPFDFALQLLDLFLERRDLEPELLLQLLDLFLEGRDLDPELLLELIALLDELCNLRRVLLLDLDLISLVLELQLLELL